MENQIDFSKVNMALKGEMWDIDLKIKMLQSKYNELMNIAQKQMNSDPTQKDTEPKEK